MLKAATFVRSYRHNSRNDVCNYGENVASQRIADYRIMNEGMSSERNRHVYALCSAHVGDDKMTQTIFYSNDEFLKTHCCTAIPQQLSNQLNVFHEINIFAELRI